MYSLTALLNLSLLPENQIEIAKLGMYTLLQINRDPDTNIEIRRISTALLHNISRNEANRTRFYKAELRIKRFEEYTGGSMGIDDNSYESPSVR